MTLTLRRTLSERDVLPTMRFNTKAVTLSDRDVAPASSTIAWPPAPTGFNRPTDLGAFRHLPPNWDSHGARPIDDHAVDAAERFLTALAGQVAPPYFPHVLPTIVGGVAIEWRSPRGELSIELAPLPTATGPAVSVYYFDRGSGEEWERPWVDVTRVELNDAMNRIMFGE